MKPFFFKVIIPALLLLMTLPSCESHEQKPDDAFQQYKNEKLNSTDSVIISNTVVSEKIKPESIKRTETQDDWTKFKIEVEKKILLNGNTIRDLKATPDVTSKLISKVEKLEKENSDLRNQMDDYNREAKAKLKKFKEGVNQDVDDISVELKDMAVANKKQ